MNYLSLLALGSILLAVPGCGGGNNGTYRRTTTTTTVAPVTEGAVEIIEYGDDKEDLEGRELLGS